MLCAWDDAATKEEAEAGEEEEAETPAEEERVEALVLGALDDIAAEEEGSEAIDACEFEEATEES